MKKQKTKPALPVKIFHGVVKTKKGLGPKKMLRNGVYYAFTLNFNTENQHFESNYVRRFRECYESMKNSLTSLSHYASFQLYPEMSTPDESWKCLEKETLYGSALKGPRFHLHGVVYFHDVMHWYMTGYRDMLKFAVHEVDTIADMGKWVCYYHKDREVIEPYCRRLHLPYKITNDTINAEGGFLQRPDKDDTYNVQPFY